MNLEHVVTSISEKVALLLPLYSKRCVVMSTILKGCAVIPCLWSRLFKNRFVAAGIGWGFSVKEKRGMRRGGEVEGEWLFAFNVARFV